jgi:hypothetical protein
MSIPFCVAAALAYGDLLEARFHALDEPEVARLTGLCRLHADPALTAAFPAKQGARVEARLRNGEVLTASLPDVTPATPDQIRQGLLSDAGEALVRLIDGLERAPDASALLAAAHDRPHDFKPRRVSR